MRERGGDTAGGERQRTPKGGGRAAEGARRAISERSRERGTENGQQVMLNVDHGRATFAGAPVTGPRTFPALRRGRFASVGSRAVSCEKDAVTRPQQSCLCRGHLTLSERGGFEFCPVCFWEDDGQDDIDAHVDRGGPNLALVALDDCARRYWDEWDQRRPGCQSPKGGDA